MVSSQKKGLLIITSILVIFILISLISATAAANTVPGTKARSQVVQSVITANDLKPPECAGLNLTEIVVGSGTINGTNASELILAGPNDDSIHGGKGNDCILGGGGDDYLRGDQGTDVCIGVPGNDSFHTTCETKIQ